MFKILKNSKGFTLVEVIMASVILSIGLMGGVQVMANTLINSVNRDLNVVATQLASEKLELMIADNYYQGYGYATDENNYPDETLEGDLSGFTRTVSFAEVDPENPTVTQEGSGINKIDVEVSWGDKDYQKVTISTLLADI